MIQKTVSGAPLQYDFDKIELNDAGLLVKKAPDSIRQAATNYAKRHSIKLICRSERINGKRIGIRIFRTA